MTQRKILVFVLLLSAFAISFAILTFDVLGEEKVPEVYDVSLIVRGKTGEQWESIKQGADQAASEMNVDLSFITLSEENNLPEQISLIQRRIRQRRGRDRPRRRRQQRPGQHGRAGLREHSGGLHRIDRQQRRGQVLYLGGQLRHGCPARPGDRAQRQRPQAGWPSWNRARSAATCSSGAPGS